MISATIDMRAPGKARPRSVAGKHPYMPKEYMQARKEFALLLRRSQNGPLGCIEGPLRLEATFSYKTLVHPDLDNVVGFLEDCLQDCGCFKNDKQIQQISATLAPKAGFDRIEFTIQRIEAAP